MVLLESPRKRNSRRHATGSSNQGADASLAGSELPSLTKRRVHPLGSVSLIANSRIVKIDEERDGEPISERRTADRPAIVKLQDRLWVHYKTSYVHKIFRSYDKNNSGMISLEQLKAAMLRLRLGLNEEETERVINKMETNAEGKISYRDFVKSFELMEHLGNDESTMDSLTRSGITNNLLTAMPWQQKCGILEAWDWERKPQGFQAIIKSNAEGSYQQHAADKMLAALVADKLTQHKERLRLLFTRMDTSKNGRLEFDEFISAIEKIGIAVERNHVERLFQMTDLDKSGNIDYDEFVKKFVPSGDVLGTKRELQEPTQEIKEAISISSSVADQALRKPMLHKLRKRLYEKANAANYVFQQEDVDRDGCLSVDVLTKCCNVLVPGIQKQDVAAVLLKVDPESNGFIDYRKFIKVLVEESPSHERLIDVELKRQADPDYAHKCMGDCPIWKAPTLPRSLMNTAPASLRSAITDEGDNKLTSAASGSMSPGASMKNFAGLSVEVPIDSREVVHQVAVSPVMDSLRRGRTWTMSLPRRTEFVNGLSDQFDQSSAAALQSSYKLSQSIDLSSLYHPDGTKTMPREGSTRTQASSRFMRFAHLKHPDTRHITYAMEGCSQHTPSDLTYMRKSDPSFIGFQKDDIEKRQIHRERAKEKHEQKMKFESTMTTTTTLNSADVPGERGGRLATMAMLKQRQAERALMTEAVRGAQEPRAAPLFQRQDIFHEQDRPWLQRG
ncbi:hypothetical protein CEUSTIGMA_g3770.t1 [Chlamydomonas eustigma]|uniref:EF-hand domain-containing protein n=1 Tax=Chlamydomonas eustigma TaxID=1157962 RepID=A0A250WZP9_9CHLO|nr:hypothetical protein CEUSTIGMA_g3770.t1 [Chlamydomonas eustigma]|eukprot:GAX76324.1 hypothetical protein CEUSTIGMA_g3770.t1 [Chlamydomonas eustigma]